MRFETPQTLKRLKNLKPPKLRTQQYHVASVFLHGRLWKPHVLCHRFRTAALCSDPSLDVSTGPEPMSEGHLGGLRGFAKGSLGVTQL